MSDPADLTIAEAGAAIRAGRLSALDLTAAHLDRIAARDPAIGAFVHVAGAEALEAAGCADRALAEGRDLGPLHGIPFAIKDIFDVAGWPVAWGSRLGGARRATRTAPAVQALLDAGAVALGLVATYELATVGPDSDSRYPQPRNPWNRDRITGGSSSGSAAALAAGMVRLALGSDTGGSIRSPSAYCGVVGLKPTAGAVSLDGVMALSPSLDHVGPMGCSVAETALGFRALTGRAVALADLDGMRIAYGRAWCDDAAAHPDLLGAMDAAASVLSVCGARIDLSHLPDYDAVERAAAAILLAEGYASHGAAIHADPGAVGPMAAASILSGAAVTPEKLAAARAVITDFRTALDAILAHHRVLILPVTLAPAPPFSAFTAGKPVWTAMRTIPFNATGHPALSVPMGFADGSPLGLQIVGRHGDEAGVLGVGAAFEAATDHGAPPPAA